MNPRLKELGETLNELRALRDNLQALRVKKETIAALEISIFEINAIFCHEQQKLNK